MYKDFNIKDIELTKYLFFTGKGGVGKTSLASSIAVNLADSGKNIMLVSTDPASNLQDVFETKLDNKGVKIKEVPNLTVANFEPEASAAEYKESVVGPFRGKLPDVVIENMEEQLSGSCTVEIASFNEFTNFIADDEVAEKYDHVIFDTAPTGHTLRMLQLPSAWTDFINKSTHGASCLGQLSGLDDKKEIYKKAVDNLADGKQTTLILVSRPQSSALAEAERTSSELRELGINNQIQIINGVLKEYDDELSTLIFNKQDEVMRTMPEGLKSLETYILALKPFNVTGIDKLRAFLNGAEVKNGAASNNETQNTSGLDFKNTATLKKVVDDLCNSDKKVIFTMGKGGVGKTTIAATIALALAEKGKKVHLTTTDPAAHLKYVIDESQGITMSYIDEVKELEKYRKEVIAKAKESNASQDDIDYIEEDLRSPCTQEIAVFRAFAEIVDRSEDEIVVIDTAPTGHTVLLLESTESYNKEIMRTKGETPDSVKKLLPKLKDDKLTEVLIISLAEATPFYEAMRLQEDLNRAGIFSKWWIINSSFYATDTSNNILKAKAENETQWIKEISETSGGNIALIKWVPEELKGQGLKNLLN
ncbi:MAG: arsenical pump-driving ATPase [Fermentimonas sp.]|nr:arsenical pump-driving ATPase [Fermentimonas sp.]